MSSCPASWRAAVVPSLLFIINRDTGYSSQNRDQQHYVVRHDYSWMVVMALLACEIFWGRFDDLFIPCMCFFMSKDQLANINSTFFF